MIDRFPIGIALNRYHLTSHILALELTARGYSPEWLSFDTFIVEVSGKVIGFSVTRCAAVTTFASLATTRKDVTAELARRAGVQVADGRAFSRRRRGEALDYAHFLGWPVVVKPCSGTKGSGVTLNIADDTAFMDAWARVQVGRVMVERQFTGGTESRIAVVDKRSIGAIGKKPPTVVGDGTSTLHELVEAKNGERSRHPVYYNRLIRLTQARRQSLARRGLLPDTVVPKGVDVVIDHTGNLSTGAEAVDVTDHVHTSYLDIAARAASAVPGLGVAGVDIIAADWRSPAEPGGYILCEINSWPGIGGHHFPSEGRPRDVAGAVVDACISAST